MDRYLVKNLFGTNISIAWYAVIMCLGIIAGAVTAYFLSKKRGFKFDLIIDYLIIAIPLAVICARLYYVFSEWDYYSQDLAKIVAVWEGGLAIYGAVIGAVIAAIIFCYWKKFPIGHILDFGGCGLIIGQAIGRWGNFVNQEAFGTAVTDPRFQKFPIAVHIDGAHSVAQFNEATGKMMQVACDEPWHLATFFYESMWNLLVFALLLVLFYKIVKRPGNIFASYLIAYGVGRAFIEGLRTDSLWLIPGVVRISQALSIVLIIGGILYLILIRKKPLKEAYYGKYCLDWKEPQGEHEKEEMSEDVSEETEEEPESKCGENCICEINAEESSAEETEVIEEAKTEDTAAQEDLSGGEGSDFMEDENVSSDTEEVEK